MSLPFCCVYILSNGHGIHFFKEFNVPEELTLLDKRDMVALMSGYTTFNTDLIGDFVNLHEINTQPGEWRNGDSINLHPFQDEMILQRIGNAPYSKLISPTGSGKSIMILARARVYLNANPDKKVLILVPELIPGAGFSKRGQMFDSLKNPLGFVSLAENLTDINDNTLEVKSAIVRKFVKSNTLTDEERILVCTHATFLKAFEGINLKHLKSCLIIIDEAHHTSHINTMGTFVEYAVKNQIKDISLMLVSATMWRTDRAPLFDVKYNNLFVTAFRGLHHHLVQANIEHVNQHIILTKKMLGDKPDYAEILKEILSDRSLNPVIYLPPGSFGDKETRTGTKFDYLEEQIFPSISSLGHFVEQIESPKIAGIKYDIHRFNMADGTLENWIELVDDSDEANRGNKKQAIIDANEGLLAEAGYPIRGIISNRMFGEGGDLTYLNSVIQLGFQASLLRDIQRRGRAMRQYPSKTTVKIFAVYPHSQAGNEDDKVREQLNTLMKGLVCAQIQQDLMQDVIIKDEPKLPRVERAGGTESFKARLFNSDWQSVVSCEKEIYEKVKEIEKENPELSQRDLAQAAVDAIAPKWIATSKMFADEEDLKEYGYLLWKRMVLEAFKRVDGTNASEIDYNLLTSVKITDGIEAYFYDLTGNTYTELLNVINRKASQDFRVFAHEYAKFTKDSHKPSNRAGDAHAYERHLVTKINTKKQIRSGFMVAHGIWYGFEEEIMTEVGLEYGLDLSQVFKILTSEQKALESAHSHLKEIQSYKNENGIIPSAVDKDKEIAKLGQWVVRRRSSNKIIFYEWHNDLAKQYGLSGLFDADYAIKQQEEMWTKRIDATIEFKNSTGSMSQKDRDMIGYLRQSKDTYPAVWQKIIDNDLYVPTRTERKEQIRQQNYKAFLKYVEENEKLPPSGALTLFITRLIKREPNSEMAKKIVKIKNEYARGAGTPDMLKETKEKNFQEYIAYVEENETLPRKEPLLSFSFRLIKREPNSEMAKKIISLKKKYSRNQQRTRARYENL